MYARSLRALALVTLAIGLSAFNALPNAARAAAPQAPPTDELRVTPSGTGSVTPNRHVASPLFVQQDHATAGGIAPARLRDTSSPVSNQPIASSGAVAAAPPRVPVAIPATASFGSFAGQGQTGWDPSDSNGAAGPYNYVETVNEQWAIYGLGGGQQYSASFNHWFGVSSNPFDPHVVYDPWGGRFIMIADTGSSILLSVSDQSNAFGGWCNYTFPTIAGFADFPELGVDDNGVYFSVNMYNSSNHSELFSLPRTSVEKCASFNYLYWSNLVDAAGNYAFSIAPATGQTYASTEYLVNSEANGGCSLTLWRLTGGSLSRNYIGTLCYSPPSAASQKGTSVKVDTGDSRIAQADYRNGYVSVALTGAYNWGSGNVNSVDWYFKINATAATLAAQHGAGSPGIWYFDPAIAQDNGGNAVVVYNSSGAAYYVNIWYLGLDSGLVLHDNNALAWGQNADTVIDPNFGTARWGDYESARPDPLDASKIWLNGQYAAALNTWGTRIGKIGSLP
jgi:hypothetical protein